MPYNSLLRTMCNHVIRVILYQTEQYSTCYDNLTCLQSLHRDACLDPTAPEALPSYEMRCIPFCAKRSTLVHFAFPK